MNPSPPSQLLNDSRWAAGLFCTSWGFMFVLSKCFHLHLWAVQSFIIRFNQRCRILWNSRLLWHGSEFGWLSFKIISFLLIVFRHIALPVSTFTANLIWDAYAGGLKNRSRSSTVAFTKIWFPKNQKCAIGIRTVVKLKFNLIQICISPNWKAVYYVGLQWH